MTSPGASSVVMVVRRLGVAIGAGAGVGTAAAGIGAGIGWIYSSVLLDPRQRPIHPERIRAADASMVTLDATRLAAQPGLWGLRWADGLAQIGPVVASRDGAVVRPLLGGPVPPAGAPAVIDAGPYDPDPGARGLAFTDVPVPTPLGPAPAWLVPAGGRDARSAGATRGVDARSACASRGDTWVVLVHGRGGSRREGLRILPALHRSGHPVLAISYRNDVGAPASPDGRYHLGDTEWEDLEAAVRYARASGARWVVLFCWSMGAAIAGAFLDRSPEAAVVRAMVWDAPLVDWRATLRQQARNRRIPAWLAPAAYLVTSRRIGIDFDRFDLRTCPPAVRPPTLIVHSTGDTAVPVASSRALAAAAPALRWPMRYLEVPVVEHTGSWNADPAAYERAVTDFLVEHLD